MKQERPTWDETFMAIAETIAQRVTCLHYKVGAVITLGKQLLSMGYNGPPRGIRHCTDAGCSKDNGGTCRGAHAEINAIINAANNGAIRIEGATFYCTLRPCLECSKHLINAGIKMVVFKDDYYKEQEAITLLKEAGIEVVKIKEKGGENEKI